MVLEVLLTLLAVLAPAAQSLPEKQPVYIFLFSRIDDHLNMEISDERIQRTLPMLARYRDRRPDYGISCLFQFTGNVSDALEQRNQANRLKDTILDYARRGMAEAGYDGSEEATWRTRPRPNFRNAKTAQERWLARSEAADWFLSEYKDPRFGTPDPARSGGLKRTQEVFGEAAFISGFSQELGGDPEWAHQIRKYTGKAVLPGLPEAQTWPARDLNGYAGSVEGIGRSMSPEPDCAPELFWQDGYLRMSDSSGPLVHVFTGHAGPEAFKAVLDKLDRSRPHVIRVQLGQQGLYLTPEFEKTLASSTVRYAYDNPKSARLPEEAFRPRAEIDAAYGREEALVGWLVEEFFPANPSSRFLSCAELKRWAKSSAGNSVTRDQLAKATSDLLRQWAETGNHPPSYARADAEYFSLADMFQMLANALAGLHSGGSLAGSVPLMDVYGPIDMPEVQGPSLGSVTVASVARVSATLATALNSKTWRPVPENAVPGWVDIDGLRLNAAQFLRLMAEAFVAPMPDARLQVKTCQLVSSAGEMFPANRSRVDVGAVWTLKPARLVRAER